MNCISNLSGAELTALANSIALYISKNYSDENIEKFVAFFTALADILALISIGKIGENLDV